MQQRYGVKTKGNAGDLLQGYPKAVSEHTQRRPVKSYHQQYSKNGKGFTASFFTPDFKGLWPERIEDQPQN